MVIKISDTEIKSIVEKTLTTLELTKDDYAGMAIPTYLHSSCLIKWLFWRRLSIISEMLDKSNFNNVLDFGCGLGTLLPTLSQKINGKVQAVDLYPQFASELCKRRCLKVEFHCGEQFINNISPNTLDLIIAADSLEHLNDPSRYLEIFKDKLIENGELIISGPTENLYYKLGRRIAGFNGDSVYHHYNVDQLKRLTLKTGYHLKEERRLPFYPCLFKILKFGKVEIKNAK